MPRLKLLGSVVLEDEEGPVRGGAARRHPLALLALLACAPSRALDRSKLVGLLWPEVPEDRARTRLNTHVYQIRRRLGENVLVSAGDTLRLDGDVLACDVHRYNEAMDAGRLERAVELYGGPLLDGFRPPRAPAFEKWMERERDRWRRAYRDALEALAEREEEHDEPAAAARWWRELADEDPYDSRVVLRLMEALESAGNPAAAVRVARIHSRLMEEELGTAPVPEVRELVERLDAGGEEPASVGSGPDRPGKGASGVEAPGAGRSEGGGPRPFGGSRARAGDEAAASAPGDGLSLASSGAAVGDGTGGASGGWARLPKAGRLGWSGLVGVGLLAGAVAGGWYLAGPDEPEPEQASLAVLPFDNLSPDPDNAYLAAGVHEELHTQLSRIAGIKLIARPSVRRYEDTERSLSEIAEELGVANVLRGSFQRVGDEVRITVQLSDAGADEQLWAETYDRELSDIFRIQTEVATRIVGDLRGVLTPEEEAELARRPTDNMVAYAHYLRGHRHGGRYFASEEAMRAAARAYGRAVELDPSFAAAWARLVQSRLWLAWFREDFDERARAREAMERLEEIAPGSPELRLARGLWLYYGEERYEEALREFDALAALWPGDVEVMELRHALLRRLGRWDESVRTMERVFERRVDASWATVMAHGYMVLRRFDEVERHARIAVSQEPGDPFAWGFLIWGRLARGDTTAARSAVDSAGRHLGDEALASRWAWGSAIYHFMTGGRAEALELYREHPFTYTSMPDLGIAVAAAHGRAALVRIHAEKLQTWARRALDSAPVEYRTIRSQALLHLALVEAYLGSGEEAVRLADRAVRTYPVSHDAFAGPDRVVWQAHVYAVAGRHDEAVERLRHLLSIPAHLITVPQLRMDLRWESLRGHPGFQALLEERGYSYRSASTGSTREARSAGR